MNAGDIEDTLRSAAWPMPSQDLRARIDVISVVPTRIPWTDRLWHSRSWRMTTAGAAVFVIAVHAWLSPDGNGTPAVDVATTQALQHLVETTGVSGDTASALARRLLPGPKASRAERQLLLSGELR
jgi:hypothetical protein